MNIEGKQKYLKESKKKVIFKRILTPQSHRK